jgi:hypothetical protein
MDESDPFAHAAMAKRMRPSVTESHQQTYSDEDLEPPSPPSVPVPPELLCRYPNKPCPQARATKKHGELHSYCAYHRFKAQRYQRKLEAKKKREAEEKKKQRELQQRSPNSDAGDREVSMLRGLALESRAVYHHSPPQKSLSPATRRQPIRARTRSSPPRPSGAMYAGPTGSFVPGGMQGAQFGSVPLAGPHAMRTLEPFHHPVSLQEGDLQLLQVFLWDSDSPPKSTDPSGANRLRASSVAARTTPTPSREADMGSGTYDISLDGFTFTSESL